MIGRVVGGRSKLLYERCFALSKTNFPVRESLGPILISDTLRELGMPNNVFGNSESFYPVKWIEAFTLWLPDYNNDIVERTKNSLFMPIFQSLPQYLGLTSGLLPPRGSYLANFCERYGVRSSNEEHYSREEVLHAVFEFLNNHSWAIDQLLLLRGGSVLKKLKSIMD